MSDVKLELTDDMRAEMRKAAEAADDGLWRVGPKDVVRAEHAMPDGGRLTKWIAQLLHTAPESRGWEERNGAHIAAAHPNNVLALLGERDGLEKRAETAEAALAVERERVRELRAALEPFAECLPFNHELFDDRNTYEICPEICDLRLAARLLASYSEDGA